MINWQQIEPAVTGLSIYVIGVVVGFLFVGLAFDLFERPRRRRRKRKP